MQQRIDKVHTAVQSPPSAMPESFSNHDSIDDEQQRPQDSSSQQRLFKIKLPPASAPRDLTTHASTARLAASPLAKPTPNITKAQSSRSLTARRSALKLHVDEAASNDDNDSDSSADDTCVVAPRPTITTTEFNHNRNNACN